MIERSIEQLSRARDPYAFVVVVVVIAADTR
jgi:hypothetical protein